MPKCICWAVTAVLLQVGPCLSQELTKADLHPGAFIRVKEWGGLPRTGVFESAETVKLIWRPGATVESGLNIPAQSILLSSIEEIHLSVGKKRLGWHGLGFGMGAFGGLGFLVGKVTYYLGGYYFDGVDEDDHLLRAAGWGALVGLPVGIFLAFGGKGDEWAPVSLPGDRVRPPVRVVPRFVPMGNRSFEVGFEAVF